MIIGVDIDGVLTDILKYAKKDLKRLSKSINGNVVYNNEGRSLAEMFNISLEQDQEFWLDYIWVYAEKVRYYSSAIKYLKKLRKQGHKIYIITSREYAGQDSKLGQKMRNIIELSFEKAGIVYDKIFYTSETQSKKEVISQNGVEILIDDSFWNLDSVSELIPVICFDQPYNRTYKNDKMTRCKGWKAVYKALSDMAKNQK